MKRETLIKIYQIDEQINELRGYNERKFLKEKELDRVMEAISKLEELKNKIVFRNKLEEAKNKRR